MGAIDKIVKLTRQLYPTGRAFKMPAGGVLEALTHAMALSEARAYDDAVQIFNNIIPDNENFTAADATAWERRLGLITNEAVPIADRRAAITRKMNFPGEVKARQNWRFLQSQLQLAGFDVYVHENRFSDGMGGYTTQNPLTVAPSLAISVQHGDNQHGEAQHGAKFSGMIANSIYEDIDNNFGIGDDLRTTFFIGGETFGTFADVSAERYIEFRQLILKIKPAQTVGFLLINQV